VRKEPRRKAQCLSLHPSDRRMRCGCADPRWVLMMIGERPEFVVRTQSRERQRDSQLGGIAHAQIYTHRVQGYLVLIQVVNAAGAAIASSRRRIQDSPLCAVSIADILWTQSSAAMLERGTGGTRPSRLNSQWHLNRLTWDWFSALSQETLGVLLLSRNQSLTARTSPPDGLVT
jgi:hypothetical protein